MFLRRAARRSAAALDHSFMSPGSFLLRVTLTLRKGRTLHRSVRVSVGGVESTLAHLGKQQQQQQQPDLVPSPGFINTDCRHLNRVAPVAVNPSTSLLSDGGQSHIFRRLLVHANRRHSSSSSSSSRGGSVGNVMFTCNWDVSSPRCSARTMQQVRASSTATKKRDAAEVEAADGNNKGEEQILREASTTTSSYTVKAPGESEPEEGKPSKTQQLKKVFKEYGAVGVSFHIGISLMSLGMFYLLVSSGIDIAALLCKLGFSEAIVRSKMAAGTSTFVLAYAIHKLFAPVRISITLVSVPLIVRYFRKTGLFKPPAP